MEPPIRCSLVVMPAHEFSTPREVARELTGARRAPYGDVARVSVSRTLKYLRAGVGIFFHRRADRKHAPPTVDVTPAHVLGAFPALPA